MKQSEDLGEWLRRRISLLVGYSNLFKEGEHYPGHLWSILKLIALMDWVRVYTVIMQNQKQRRGWPDEIWYIDLFAGPGTTLVEEKGYVAIGSPFIAHFFAFTPFDRYYYVEKEHKRALTLERRKNLVGDLKGRAAVWKGDSNEEVLRLERLWEKRREEGVNVHSLVFIDNEGFDFSWSSLNILLEMPSDIILLFPTSSLNRTIRSSPRRVLRFIGEEEFPSKDEDTLLDFYKSKIKTVYEERKGKRGYVESITIGRRESARPFYYDLILVTKEGKYVDAWTNTKRKISKVNPEVVDPIMDAINGKVETLMDLLRERGPLEEYFE